MADRNNPDAFANALTGVYATNPDYGSDLIQLMQQYNLYRYDAPATGAGPPPAPRPRAAAQADKPRRSLRSPGSRHGLRRHRTADVRAPASGPSPDARHPRRPPRPRRPAPAAHRASSAADAVPHRRHSHATPHAAATPRRRRHPRRTAPPTPTTVNHPRPRPAPHATRPAPPRTLDTRRPAPGSTPRGVADAAATPSGRPEHWPRGRRQPSRADPTPGGPRARGSPWRAVAELRRRTKRAQRGNAVDPHDRPVSTTVSSTLTTFGRPAAPRRPSAGRPTRTRTGLRSAVIQHRLPTSVKNDFVAHGQGPAAARRAAVPGCRRQHRPELGAACGLRLDAVPGPAALLAGARREARARNHDGSIYRSRSEALEQCAVRPGDLAGAVYGIDLATSCNCRSATWPGSSPRSAGAGCSSGTAPRPWTSRTRWPD